MVLLTPIQGVEERSNIPVLYVQIINLTGPYPGLIGGEISDPRRTLAEEEVVFKAEGGQDISDI
jgi:hypothetical protein